MDQVDPHLRSIFRSLAAGKAKWPLFLHGPTGTGKTCAVLAFSDFVKAALYFLAEELADAIMAGGIVWQRIGECQLAICDEVGARERIGDLHYQAIKRFADLRDHRPAIYVSNCHPDALGKLYDDRIVSRVLCGTWYECQGEDRRMA